MHLEKILWLGIAWEPAWLLGLWALCFCGLLGWLVYFWSVEKWHHTGDWKVGWIVGAWVLGGPVFWVWMGVRKVLSCVVKWAKGTMGEK